MDIFDLLTAISERKITFIHSGMNEQEAVTKTNLEISREYHISLLDIKKLVEGRDSVRSEVRRYPATLFPDIFPKLWSCWASPE
jgi:hypothetical protein